MARDVFDILLVEDSEADILLAELAFDEVGLPHRLHVARDGVEALEFLEGAQSGPNGLPNLILLDLNMPRMSGLEVLLEVKAHPVWRNIPVIVLTTSSADGDVWQSYQRHANAYMSKPSSLPQFVERLRKLSTFWQAVATLPPRRPPGV